MVAAPPLELDPAEDLRKHVIRLLQASGEETKGNILVLPQVFLEFLDYDHKMALFLNKLLYWTERTRNPDKWVYKTYRDWFQELGFKESVIRRLLHGDRRSQTRKRTLADIGVEQVVRRAPNGSPTCHYRLNLAVFLEAVRTFLAHKHSPTLTAEPAQCTGSTLGNGEDGTEATPAVEGVQCAERIDPQTPTQISSEENPAGSSQRDDDFQGFMTYEQRFGQLKPGYRRTFATELARLGASRVGEVLERCATRGRSWAYVLKALANEQAPTAQTDIAASWADYAYTGAEGELPASFQNAEAEAPLPVSERVQTPWVGLGTPDGTVQEAWRAAYHQLELQLDRNSFDSGLRTARFVDFDLETRTFVLAVRHSYACELLQHRLKRTVRRILSDVYGQPVEVRFVLNEEWVGQHGSGERIA